MPKPPVITVDSGQVVLDIKGKFDPQTVRELTAAMTKASDFAAKFQANFFQPHAPNGRAQTTVSES